MRTTLKLVLPLIVSVALVSLLFAGYQVRTERRTLRTDVSRRAEVLAESLQESIEPLFEKNDRASERTTQKVVDRFAQREHIKGIAVYLADGSVHVMTSTLGAAFKRAPKIAGNSMERGAGAGEFTRVEETPVFLFALPLERAGSTAGALVVIYDTSFIDARVLLTLRDALLTALLETLLISGLALVLVRWTFLDPLKRTAKWLKNLRAGEIQGAGSLPEGELFERRILGRPTPRFGPRTGCESVCRAS